MADSARASQPDVLIGKAGHIHLLVSRTPSTTGRDWLVTPPLSELRTGLTRRLRTWLRKHATAPLQLPPVGPVTSRLRLEALVAVVDDLGRTSGDRPREVLLIPEDGDAPAAIETLRSLTLARGLASTASATHPGASLTLPTAQDLTEFAVGSGRAVGTGLTSTTALSTSTALASLAAPALAGGALAGGGAGMAAGMAALGGPALMAFAGPVGLVGAAGILAGGFFGQKGRQEKLAAELKKREKAWKKAVKAREKEIQAHYEAHLDAAREQMELLAAENHSLRQQNEQMARERGELQAALAEQVLALAECRARSGATEPGPELAQPIAFAVSLASDPGEPAQRRENLKYAWRLLVRYIGALMLADLERRGQCPKSTATAIQSALHHQSGEGRWLHLCRTVAELTSGTDSFFAAPLDLWRRGKKGYGHLLAALDRVKVERNDAEHGARIPAPAEVERWLSSVQPHWSQALDAAQVYTACPLFIVEALVDHAEDGGTIYQVRWLVGDRLYPHAERVVWPIRVRRGCLYILRAGVEVPQGPEDVLDVSTFLRWEHSQVLDRPETYGVVGLEENVLQFGAFRFQDEKALGGSVPAWLAAR